MKILQINKFLYPQGGTETYLLSLISLLSKNGHQVIGFYQKNKNNINLAGKEFFISDIKLNKFYFKNIFKIGRIFWSLEAKKNIQKLIDKENIDIVHIHNIYHQISPSILPVIKKAGLPIIMTVHDFKLVSPHYTLWATKNNKNPKPAIAKALMTMEYFFHKSLKIYKKNIDLFIAPSEFVKTQLIKSGFDANKIIVLPHFVETINPNNTIEEKNYLVCFGRLDASKGINVLIEAFSKVKNETTLKIIGSGPAEKKLKKLALDLGIKHRIEFIPHCSKTDLEKIITQSLFTVFPSLVHETFGLGVIESHLLGKAVIATKVGAYSENIVDQKTGLLVEPNNPHELTLAIEKLITNPDLRQSMDQLAQNMASQKFTSELHLTKIISIYKSLINQSTAAKRHYQLEKYYANKILQTPTGEVRNQIITQAYDAINSLVNSYRPAGIRGHNQSTFKLIKNLSSKEKAILDYGCGAGELVNLLAKNGYQATGFDVSPAMISEAKKQAESNSKFISGQLDNLKNKYDLIVMDNVIEHIAPDEIKETLLKLKTILKDHGRLLIITPHQFSGPHDISGHFLKLGSKAQGLHLKEFNLHELVSDVKKCDYNRIYGYFINPRINELIKLNIKPRQLWLKKSLILEQIFNHKSLNWLLRINKKLTKLLIALMFPTIIVAQK